MIHFHAAKLGREIHLDYLRAMRVYNVPAFIRNSLFFPLLKHLQIALILLLSSPLFAALLQVCH